MKQNVGNVDRLIRVLAIAPVAVLLAGSAGWATGWGIVALVVAGIMVVTAAVGFCPLYALLGINTRRARRPVHA